MAEDRFDVLVIGGGITGMGVALDAAARGLSVAPVEKDGFASGTSGRSSRLIHGSIRYLEHGELGLVHEALRERKIHQVPRNDAVSLTPLNDSNSGRIRSAEQAVLYTSNLTVEQPPNRAERRDCAPSRGMRRLRSVCGRL